MLTIFELLKLRGLDVSRRVKLVRHQDKRYDVNELSRLRQLEIYQSYQSKPIFECDYIVSFVGFGSTLGRMFGVYRVKGRMAAKEAPELPDDFLYKEFVNENDFYYELEGVPGFEDLNNRVVIEWGRSALSWHQWLRERKSKEVVEILPVGHVRAFPGYLDFILAYDELVTICRNPRANGEWHTALSAVAGVYLIVDKKTGLQYVGSAYGDQGILGRWEQYARSGHGGNARLSELLEKPDSSVQDLRFTILRTLPKTLTKNEVIAHEVLFKLKLGSRAFGLNAN